MKTIGFFLSVMLVPLLAFSDCSEKQGNTAELKQCWQEEYQKADKELNILYAQLMTKLDAEGKEKLKKAQRIWIQFRDADAEFSADRNRGGTFAGVAQIGTLGDLTRQRIKELKVQLEIYK